MNKEWDTLLRVQLTSAVHINWLSGNYLPDKGVLSNLHVGYNSKNCTEVVRLLDSFIGLRKPERQDKGSQAVEVILLHVEVQICACSSSPFLLFHCVLFRQYTHTQTSTQMKKGILKTILLVLFAVCMTLFRLFPLFSPPTEHMIAIMTPPSASSSMGEALVEIDSNGRVTLRVAAVLVSGASRYNLQDSAGRVYFSTSPSRYVPTSQSVGFRCYSEYVL